VQAAEVKSGPDSKSSKINRIFSRLRLILTFCKNDGCLSSSAQKTKEQNHWKQDLCPSSAGSDGVRSG